VLFRLNVMRADVAAVDKKIDEMMEEDAAEGALPEAN
jgi:hypothetical protein